MTCAPRRGLVGVIRTAAVVLLVALVAVGCTETPLVRAGNPVVSNSADSGGGDPSDLGSGAGSPSAVSTGALAEAKKAAGIADCPTSSGTAPVVTEGLPDVTLDCLGGGRSVRLAGLRGTPMVINVWAQWCGPCRTEAPALAAVAAQAGDRVLIMGIDYADPRPDLALAFAADAGQRYPQLVDRDKVITDRLRLPAAPPQTIFVAADGTITGYHAGAFTSAAALRAAIAEHLGVTL